MADNKVEIVTEYRSDYIAVFINYGTDQQEEIARYSYPWSKQPFTIIRTKRHL